MRLDFGSKSLPIEIAAGESYEFAVQYCLGDEETQDGTFELYVDANNRLTTKTLDFQLRLKKQPSGKTAASQ